MAEIENLKPNGWEVEDVKEISGGFKYYVVDADYFDDEDNEQEGFWVWDDEIKKDDKGRFRESTKKFGKKFAKESFDDMEKEFTYKGISITRYDYESLPSPMAASKFSDEQMQEIAKDIYFELVNKGWDEKEIQKYVNNVDDYELPDAEMRVADKIRSDWWEAMEDVARYHGMEYYEDLPEEEENYTESKKFGKKFMKESFYGIEGAKDVDWAIIYKNCHIEPSEFYGNLGELYDEEHPEDPNHKGFDDWCWENTDLIESELEHLASYDDNYEGDPYYKESKKFGKKFANESMNWNGVTDKFLDNDKVQFTRNCPSCGKPHSITVSIRDVEHGCSAYGRGARIQDAFPNFSPDEREFFMSGICPDCWENM